MANRKLNYTFADVQDAVDNQTKTYRESIKNQATRIGAFVTYLSEKGLLDDFNIWEEKLRKESERGTGNAGEGTDGTTQDSKD